MYIYNNVLCIYMDTKPVVVANIGRELRLTVNLGFGVDYSVLIHIRNKTNQRK